jgi:hypothetical protein
MVIELKEVVVEPRMRGLCRLPYPGHPRGCPNFGRKAGCPPSCPMIGDAIDLGRPVFAIVNEFDLAAHVLRMRLRHPGWSERQLVCCLYWQPTARKHLTAKLMAFLAAHPDYVSDACPEAGGVNVTETLRRAGLELEWPPVKVARQVALAGIPARGRPGR